MYKVHMWLQGKVHEFFAKTLRGAQCKATRLAIEHGTDWPEIEIFKGNVFMASKQHVNEEWLVSEDAYK